MIFAPSLRFLGLVGLSLVACGGSHAPDGGVIALGESTPSRTGGAQAAPENSIQSTASVPFSPSGCARENVSLTARLHLGTDPKLLFAEMGSDATVRFADGLSTFAHARIASWPDGYFEGLVALDDVPFDAPGAFDGWAVVRTLDAPYPITAARPVGNDIELTLGMPAGVERVGGSQITVPCATLRPADEGQARLPTSSTEQPVTLEGTSIPLARTPGGPAVAELSPARFSRCQGTTLHLETRGSDALIRVYLGSLVVYGWVPSSVLRPQAPPAAGCEFGFVGGARSLGAAVLSRDDGAGKSAKRTRLVCRERFPLAAHVKGKTFVIGMTSPEKEHCLFVKRGFDATYDEIVDLAFKPGPLLTMAPDATLLAPRAALAKCERDDSDQWRRCD